MTNAATSTGYGNINLTLGTAPTAAAPVGSPAYTGTAYLNGTNSFNGTTTIDSGTLILGSAAALGNNAGTISVNNATGDNLVINGGTLDLNGYSQNVRSISSIAPLVQTATSATAVGGIITNNGTSNVTLTENGPGNFVFGGTIQDGTTNKVGLVLDGINVGGIGAQYGEVFTGTNTYTGATTVDPGSMLYLGDEAFLSYGLNAGLYNSGSISNSTVVTLNGGTNTNSTGIYAGAAIDFAESGTVNYAGSITGTGDIRFQGTGTTNLNSALSDSGRVEVNNGTVVLNFAAATAPTSNILYNGDTIHVASGVSTTSGSATIALTGASSLGIAVGDFAFFNGEGNGFVTGGNGIVTSVGTNSFTVASSSGLNTFSNSSAVFFTPSVVIPATTHVTLSGGTDTVTGVNTTSLYAGEYFAYSANGGSSYSVGTVGAVTSVGTSGSFTFTGSVASGTSTNFDISAGNLSGLYLSGVLGYGLNGGTTSTNTGGTNFVIQGANGVGTTIQDVPLLSDSIVGSNGSNGNAPSITLSPGTGGNTVVLNIGAFYGGAQGGESLNINIPSTNAYVTLADPYGIYVGSLSNGYEVPYINGYEMVTLNNNDFAVVNTATNAAGYANTLVGLGTLSASGSTSAANYFQYGYTPLAAATTYSGLSQYSSVGDVLTGGGTATITSSALGYRFNETNKADTLNFNVPSGSYFADILVTSAVGSNLSKITGTPLGNAAGNRGEVIYQDNPSGTLEIDNSLIAGPVGITKSGPGTVLLTATSGYTSSWNTAQGMTIVDGNVVAPTTLTATYNSGSSGITFATAGATSGLYVGETVDTISGSTLTSAGFVSAITSGTTATLSTNFGTSGSAVNLFFAGGGGMGMGAEPQIANGATLQIGNNDTNGNLTSNISNGIINNGAIVFDWTGTGSAANNFNTFTSTLNGGIGSVSTSVAGSTTTLIGNNGYAGGTYVAANTKLIAEQTAAGTVTGSYTVGSNIVNVTSGVAGLVAGETLTATGLSGTIVGISGNNVYLNTVATGSGSSASIANNALATALPTGSNRDNAYGTTGVTDNGFGVFVSGTLDLGGYNLNSSTTVDFFQLGTLFLYSGGTIQDGTMAAYMGYNVSGGTEAVNTSFQPTYYGQGLTKTTSATAYLNGLNTYTTPTTISGGILNFATAGGSTSAFNGGSASGLGAASNAATNLILDGGTLQYTGNTVVLASNTSAAGSSVNPLLDQLGTATVIQTTDRLFSITSNGGAIDSSGTYALQFTNTGSDVSSGTGNRTLTLTGSQVASTIYGTSSIASVLADASVGNTLAVSKTGAGTWSLTGANTYTGGTTVSNGTLLANNTSGSATGTGGVTVQSGATLGGGAGAANVAAAPLVNASTGSLTGTYKNYTSNKVGIVSGTTEIMSGGTLAPGNLNRVGTLTTSALTLDAGSIVDFDFSPSTAASSLVAVTSSGGLTLDGTRDVTLNLFLDGTSSDFTYQGTYNLFSYVGTLGGTGIAALTADVAPGVTYTFVNDTTDHVIQIDLVPEPQTWAMLLGGLGLLVAIRRARSRSGGN
jgi:fibronectin-binding autotransporter adhesin